jgi:hypothetical protein
MFFCYTASENMAARNESKDLTISAEPLKYGILCKTLLWFDKFQNDQLILVFFHPFFFSLPSASISGCVIHLELYACRRQGIGFWFNPTPKFLY